MTSTGARLVSVGNVVADITVRVPQLPARDADVLARSGGLGIGGCFNVLVAAIREGLPAAYGGAHGTGPFGDAARAAMKAAGVAALLPPVPDEDTGYSIAITEEDGERTFITAVGAEARLTPELVGTLAVSPGDFVHVSGYGLLHDSNREAILRLLDRLPAATVVLLDPGPLGHDILPAALARVLHRANWWSGSRTEATRVTGCPDPAAAALQLARAHAPIGIVLRLGADGCLILPPGNAHPVHLPGFPVHAVDTNGAGDTHVGAFLAALAAGRDPIASARRANMCAAISTTRPGPATAPTAAEVAAFIIQDSV